MAQVAVENVSKDYLLGLVQVSALRAVSLAIEPGRFTALLGPSGSGKSTLLNLLGCIEEPTRGRVLFDGEDVWKLTDAERSDLRARRIGFVFQSFNLISVLSVLENVEYPLWLQRTPRKERRARGVEMLKKVGLSGLVDRLPATLSGGERQRVAIARALIARPSLLLADEPTANLDSKTASEVIRLLKGLVTAERISVLCATHDARVVPFCDETIELADGKLVSERRVQETV